MNFLLQEARACWASSPVSLETGMLVLTMSIDAHCPSHSYHGLSGAQMSHGRAGQLVGLTINFSRDNRKYGHGLSRQVLNKTGSGEPVAARPPILALTLTSSVIIMASWDITVMSDSSEQYSVTRFWSLSSSVGYSAST